MTKDKVPKTQKRSVFRKVRRILWYTFLGVLTVVLGYIAYVFFYPMPEHDAWSLVPKEAVFVIEADDPIENWKSFSKTPMWKHLKKNELFAEIEAEANYLDTLIHDNQKVLNLIAGKKLLLVGQMYKQDDYDFVYLMDLKSAGKVSFFIDIFKPIINAFGVDMHGKELGGYNVYGIGEGNDELMLGFLDNVMVMSFSKKLFIDVLKQFKAVENGQKTFFITEEGFQTAHSRTYNLTDDESVAKLHMNFDQLDDFMKVYMDDVSGPVTDMSKVLEYLSLDMKMHDDFAKMGGYIAIDDSVPSMFTVMQKVEHSRIRAHQVLPANTSFLLSLDFSNFDTLYSAISDLMKDSEGFKEFENTKKSVGGFLGLRVKERKAERRRRKGKDTDYFDWLGSEIALAMMPMNRTGSQQAYVCLIHSPDRKNSMHDLEKIGKKLPNMRWKKVETYHGHALYNLKFGAFIRLFLGKLVNKFESPKYTVLDEFVVFSNDTAALHRIIDVNNGKHASLPMDGGFRKFFREFEPESNYFMYINTHELYGNLPGLFGREAARGVRKNKQFITCFPRVGMQLGADDGQFKAEMYFQFSTEEKEGLWKQF